MNVVLTPPAVRSRVALSVLLVAEAMNLLDSTITTVASPVIRFDLHGSAADIAWVNAAYTLPFAVLLILGGRLGDIHGRRRIFRIGTAGFVLTSVACAAAASIPELIGFRAAQGACAALVIPQTIGLIKAMFTGTALSRALSMIGPVMGLAAVLGPVLGGTLTAADVFGSSWRSVFLVNVPLGLAILALSGFLAEDRAVRRPRLDVLGTVLAAAAMAALVYPLVQGPELGRPWWLWGCGAAGFVLLAALAAHIRRSAAAGRDPLVEPTLFADRGFPAALLTSLLFFAATTGLLLVVQVRLQVDLGFSPLVAGLTLLPWSAGLAVSSLVAGRVFVPKWGNRTIFPGFALLLTGVVLAAVACAGNRDGAYPWAMLAPLGLCGLGAGLVSVPFFTAALGRVRPQETGSAAGSLNAVQQLGGTVGVAALVTIALGGGAVAAFVTAAALVVAATVAATAMVTGGGDHEAR